MAADLIMPALPGHDQQSRHFLPPQRPMLHSRTQSYHTLSGPLVSPISGTHLSPNQACSFSTPPSPKGHSTRRRRPAYMPAVLRPCDEFPPRIMTPTRLSGSTSDSDSDTTLRRTNSNLMSLPGLGALGHKLTRRTTGESVKTLDGDWNLDSFPEPEAPPTRSHWKADPDSTICDDPTCKRAFNYFVRRHHCRRCGNIFCDGHSSYVLPLDQHANFNPRAVHSRACNHCFQEVKAQHSRHNSQSSAAPSSAEPSSIPSTPIVSPGGLAPTAPSGPEIAASVPRDWNWSTF
ncbi:FYVE domain protein [Drechmeria coniospora]|uniref:FYVE domain protein n=1 Tax=Drechmeria coniospora TaxID=98403 RepID=A0A151GMF6_DRECN|nr:FYVE domain protein [Drechmeria coniospora]KYK58304.1 FYVE domain protein [Drechmeria coniospora]ODA82859.1 hypothetical protein RJ55_01368 [Drechmeria coniospora]